MPCRSAPARITFAADMIPEQPPWFHDITVPDIDPSQPTTNDLTSLWAMWRIIDFDTLAVSGIHPHRAECHQWSVPPLDRFALP